MSLDLIVFNADNCPKSTGDYSKRPVVTLSKSGCVYFSKKASEIIGLQNNTKVSFVQDAKEKENWYLCIDEKGFETKQESGKESFKLHHKILVEKLNEVMNLKKGVTHKFLLAGIPTQFKGDKKTYHGLLSISVA